METSGLVYDYSTGNVGIGVTSPSGRLHVSDTSGNLPFYVTSNIGDGTGVLAKFDRTTTNEVLTVKASKRNHTSVEWSNVCLEWWQRRSGD